MSELSAIDPQQVMCWQTRRIVEALGINAALKLLKKRGGTRIKVPHSADQALTLLDLLGSESATQQFIDAFCNVEYVYLPKADKIIAAMRNAAIIAERRQGATISQIALRHDLTIAWVKRILSQQALKGDGPAPQRDLFNAA